MKKGQSSGRREIGRSVWRGVALSASLLPVLVVTLSPSAESNTVSNSLFCVLCGTAGTANLVRNVILFVPFGAALRLADVEARWALPTVLAITVGIEAWQFFIPGRNPGVIDLSANFAGGALGYTGGGAIIAWYAGGARKSESVVATWCLLASLLLLLTSQLFRVEVPDSPLYGHQRPELGHLDQYEGQVLWATIDGLPLSQGAVADAERIRHALSTGAVVRAAATSALPSDGLAPIVMITNGRYEEILLIGIEGFDVVARVRYLADELRFHRPDLRLRGVLEDIPVGDTVVVEWDLRGDGSCVSVNSDTRCEIGPYLEEGWSLLLAPTGLSAWMRSGLSFSWMFGLFFPLGFFGRRDLLTAAAFGVLTSASFSGWWVSSVSPPTFVGMAGMVAGSLAGMACYRLLLRSSKGGRSITAHA